MEPENQSTIPSINEVNSTKLTKYALPFFVITTVLLSASTLFFILNSNNSISEPNLNVSDSSPTPTQSGEKNNSNLINNICSNTGCLFKYDGYIRGMGKIQGYYKAETRSGYGIESVCDRFIITNQHKNTQPLIDDLKRWVESGNTINTIENSRLVLNINLKDVTKVEQELIKQSNANNLTELSIIRFVEGDTGADTCDSLINIVKAEKFIQ
jgi:hypothetical protein